MQEIIRIAKNQIGVSEKPVGSNNIIYNTWFYGHPVSGSNYHWCAVFVSWCANQAGISTEIIPKTAAVSSLLSFFKNKNQFKPKGYIPQPGDIMIQKEGVSHTGIVIESTNVTFSTIEGNTSDKVAKRSYSINDSKLTGFGTPAYTDRQNTNFRSANSANDSQDVNTENVTQNKGINSTIIKSITGLGNITRKVINVENDQAPSIELYINNHENKTFQPIVKDQIKWETARKNMPGKLTFTVLKDELISFNEGSIVILRVNKKNIFYGYVFSKSRDKNHHISVTAYDQLRYLKNKHTYIYQNKGVDDLLRLIAADFGLKIGELENTNFKIAYRLENNNTLFDIIQTAITDTCVNTGELFVLYDDFGSLTLKNIKNMVLNDIVITADNTQNFDYKTTIDSNVYNKVDLFYDNTETGQREFYISQDPTNIQRWGVLQLSENLNENENPSHKAQTLLKYYNKVQRSLTLKGVLGDYRVRGGYSIYTQFNLGDLIISKLMLVENVIHTFSNQSHLMDLQLVGFNE